MSALKLIIGNKKYSSWSMRPWLLLKHHQIPFEEIRIPLYQGDWQQALSKYSPTGMVPVLHDGDLVIGESLAICEYLADKFPEIQAWPRDQRARALARSVSTEMHAGFATLRQKLTTNLTARYRWQDCGEQVNRDIRRIEQIWTECRERYGKRGAWLFGDISIADAMFAPVATRFVTYNVPIGKTSREYIETIYQWPAFLAWRDAAMLETEVIPEYEYTDWVRNRPN